MHETKAIRRESSVLVLPTSSFLNWTENLEKGKEYHEVECTTHPEVPEQEESPHWQKLPPACLLGLLCEQHERETQSSDASYESCTRVASEHSSMGIYSMQSSTDVCKAVSMNSKNKMSSLIVLSHHSSVEKSTVGAPVKSPTQGFQLFR